MLLSQTEAKRRHLLVYNSGKKCKEKHDPTIRITTTGRCMICEKLYHRDRLKKQQKTHAKKRANGMFKAVYTFTFPDGERIAVGPFATSLQAQRSLENRWLAFYGINFNTKFLPVHESNLKLVYKWKE